MSSESQCITEELKSYEAISYEIRGLHPDTKYRIHLRAHNVLGFSLPSQLYIQTALGEYNQESNEVPIRAGFYDVYIATNPLQTSSVPSFSSYFGIVFISYLMSLLV